MDTFLVAFKTVLPLFLIILIGLVFSRTKVSSENWVDILNKYALWIGFPALVVASLMHLELGEQSYSSLLLINSGYIVVCMLLAIPVSKIFRFSNEMKRALFLILPFGNIAYLGMPVLANAFGKEILPVAAIIAATYVFWLLTLALILIEVYGDKGLNVKKLGLSLIKNPLLLSVFVGLIIIQLKINLPDFAEQTIQFFANSVTAVVLFSLGIFLGMQKLGNLKEWGMVAVFVFITMLFIPFVFSQFAGLFNIDNLQFKATIIDSAMPLGLTPYALAVQYKIKPTLVARIVVLGTLFSIVIIPLWLVWMG